MRKEMPANRAIEWAQEGNEAFVPALSGVVYRWRILRGDLVIDTPPRSIYNLVTDDAGEGGQEPPGSGSAPKQLPLL